MAGVMAQDPQAAALLAGSRLIRYAVQGVRRGTGMGRQRTISGSYIGRLVRVVGTICSVALECGG